MANDAILDKLKAEKDRLDSSIERMQRDGAVSSSWGTQWALVRVPLERLRMERDLVNFKILQRLAFINGRSFAFGGSVQRTLTVMVQDQSTVGQDTTPTEPETPVTPSTPVHPVHPGTHYRYIGWSPDSDITPGRVANGQQYTGDVLTVPDGGPGFLWFAVDVAAGYPDSLVYQGNIYDQLSTFHEQANRVLVHGINYVVGVSAVELGENAEGITLTLGYA